MVYHDFWEEKEEGMARGREYLLADLLEANCYVTDGM
jgi:hypothetical protein